jgi:Protein of unknown function (DUF2442)
MDDEKMVRVRSVEPLNGFRVRLGFTDGSSKETDLEPYLRGPVFEPIRADAKILREVSVDHRAGTIVWPNGADIDPDVLYLGLKPAWMEAEEEELLTK